jgi:hypothetical protein
VRVELRPCKFREGKFTVLEKAELEVLELAQLRERLLLTENTPLVRAKITHVRSNAYVGIVRGVEGAQVGFVLLNDDRSGNCQWLLKKDPTFADRLVEAWKVEAVHMEGSTLQEVA